MANAVQPCQEPCDKTQEVNREALKVGAALMKEGTAKRQSYIFVNSRLEGNALATIQAMVSAAEG